MLKIIIALFFMVPSLSFAKESKGKEFNMPDFSKISKKLKEKEDSESYQTTCTNSTGKVFKPTEKGFDSCLANARSEAEASAAQGRIKQEDQSQESSPNVNKPGSVGIQKNFKF